MFNLNYWRLKFKKQIANLGYSLDWNSINIGISQLKWAVMITGIMFSQSCLADPVIVVMVMYFLYWAAWKCSVAPFMFWGVKGRNLFCSPTSAFCQFRFLNWRITVTRVISKPRQVFQERPPALSRRHPNVSHFLPIFYLKNCYISCFSYLVYLMAVDISLW